MAKITRFCKLTEDKVGSNVFDVSRATVLGNPYTHLPKKTKAQVKVKTREEAIDLYKMYFREMMASDDPRSLPFKTYFKKIVNAYRTYDEIFIGCYCSLNESCHGDFIAEEVQKYAIREMIRDRWNGIKNGEYDGGKLEFEDMVKDLKQEPAKEEEKPSKPIIVPIDEFMKRNNNR